jgi:toxin ParE1/3/4
LARDDRVIVAPQAKIDLLDIIRYLATVASRKTADRWDQKFWTAIEQISGFPGSGAPRPILGTDVRIKIIGPFIMIYEYTPALNILRVVRGRRQITRKLLTHP